ncbi:MAG: DUF86 domain-containing protein [Pseudomonadota bacterium]
MPRDYRVSLEDMVRSLARIRTLTSAMSYEEFVEDLTRQEAVIRNLEIIGEASKSVPHAVRSRYPEVDWARIGGLRDVLIHQYFGIDLEIIWDIVQTKLPDLDAQIKRILSELG